MSTVGKILRQLDPRRWFKSLKKRRDFTQHLRDRGARIDPGVFVASDVRIIQRKWAFLLEMEKGASIGAGSTIVLHDSAATILGGLPTIKYGRVVFRRFACVGTGSIILPGVELGEFSLVAAGSVVNSSIPPRTVWGGNPARFICTLETWSRRLKELNQHPGKHDLFIDGHFPEGFEAFREAYLAERDEAYREREKARQALPEPKNQAPAEPDPSSTSEPTPPKTTEPTPDGDPADRIAEFVFSRYEVGDADRDTPLFTEGLLDSFALIELVQFVEDTWDLSVPPDERQFETFDSVDAIAEYVRSKQTPTAEPAS